MTISPPLQKVLYYVIKLRKKICRDFIKQILLKVASLIERLQVNIQSQFSIDFETETTTFQYLNIAMVIE